MNRRPGPVFGYPTANLPQKSWVLIFNAGQEDEGLYTLQGQQRGTYVLAFENQDEAARFATLLQADGFDEPAPTAWQKDQLSEFCAERCTACAAREELLRRGGLCPARGG